MKMVVRGWVVYWTALVLCSLVVCETMVFAKFGLVIQLLVPNTGRKEGQITDREDVELWNEKQTLDQAEKKLTKCKRSKNSRSTDCPVSPPHTSDCRAECSAQSGPSCLPSGTAWCWLSDPWGPIGNSVMGKFRHSSWVSHQEKMGR